MPNEPIYLNTPFSYVSWSGAILDYYTKSEIDAKTTVLQAGIDITYNKAESDARYYTKSESDVKLALNADFNVGQLPNFSIKLKLLIC